LAHSYSMLRQWQDWLSHETLGRHLLEAEAQLLTTLLTKQLGKHVVLLGVPQQLNLLNTSRLAVHTLVSPLPAVPDDEYHIESNLHELPILTGSIDLVIIPHTLEFIDRGRQLLNEACRVIKPEGLVVIVGFNPYSLWGFAKNVFKSKQIPGNGHFINTYNVKNWLQLAEFQLESHSSILFNPPFANINWYKKLNFLESVGKMLFPKLGGVYLIVARAKVIPLTPIRTHWKQQLSGITIRSRITGQVMRHEKSNDLY